jgi:RimJ/RimL family protein N-acetyltransferase
VDDLAPDKVEMDQKPPPELTILETPRLRLRRTTHADIPSLIALWTDPEVTRYMGGPRDEEVLMKVFTEAAEDPFAEDYDLWPVEEKASGVVIGDCGLSLKEIDSVDEIELVYVISPDHWGRGYATEIALALKRHAFEALRLARLVSLIDPENAASQRVAEKVGMKLQKEVVRPGGNLRRLFAVDNLEPGGRGS